MPGLMLMFYHLPHHTHEVVSSREATRASSNKSQHKRARETDSRFQDCAMSMQWRCQIPVLGT